MPSGLLIDVLKPEGCSFPGQNYAQLDIRVGGSSDSESVSVLDFDGNFTNEYMDWKVRMPDNYSGGGITMSFEYSMTSATSGTIVLGAAIRRIADDADDIDASHTYDYNYGSADTVPNVAGETSKVSVTFTDGADMDSWSAGETAIIRVHRKMADAGDTVTTDLELWNVLIKET